MGSALSSVISDHHLFGFDLDVKYPETGTTFKITQEFAAGMDPDRLAKAFADNMKSKGSRVDELEEEVARLKLDRDEWKELVESVEAERIELRKELNHAMELGCGVYREQETMQTCVEEVDALKARAAHLKLEDSSKVFNTELIAALELEALIDVSETLVNAAVVRKESRGAHTCRDFPTRDDESYLHHSLAFYQSGARPRLDKKEVTLGHWVPEERKY